MKTHTIKPLWRKVNTRARGVRHYFGSDFSKTRNKNDPTVKMKRGEQRGLDYTPLFRFLLSRVGERWDDVYSSVVNRVASVDPIFDMVRVTNEPKCRYTFDESFFRYGESSFWSSLFVDDNGILRKVNEEANETSIEPSCGCCTHTFNGVQFTRKYNANS